MTTPQHHDDPLGEATSKVVQALAVLTTVGEFAARFAAAGAQNRAARAERRANAARIAGAARRHADQAAARAYAAALRADHQLMDRAFDNAWLADADLHTAAVLWRTAAIYAVSGDQRALTVIRRAETRLAQLNPGLVEAYRRQRSHGSSLAEAMRVAANQTWEHQTRPAADTPPADPVGTPDRDQPGAGALDEATRVELVRLAADLDPHVVAGLERQWRSAGHTPAADAASRLANAAAPQAGARRGAQPPGAATIGTVDPQPRAPSTGRGPADQIAGSATENEAADDERHDGQGAGHVRHDAPSDRAGIEQRRRPGRAFRPLGTVDLVFSHAPAPTPVEHESMRRKGSIR